MKYINDEASKLQLERNIHKLKKQRNTLHDEIKKLQKDARKVLEAEQKLEKLRNSALRKMQKDESKAHADMKQKETAFNAVKGTESKTEQPAQVAFKKAKTEHEYRKGLLDNATKGQWEKKHKDIINQQAKVENLHRTKGHSTSFDKVITKLSNQLTAVRGNLIKLATQRSEMLSETLHETGIPGFQSLQPKQQPGATTRHEPQRASMPAASPREQQPAKAQQSPAAPIDAPPPSSVEIRQRHEASKQTATLREQASLTQTERTHLKALEFAKALEGSTLSTKDTLSNSKSAPTTSTPGTQTPTGHNKGG